MKLPFRVTHDVLFLFFVLVLVVAMVGMCAWGELVR